MKPVHSLVGDWSQLRVLVALLRTESTVEAARELGLSQSAVSHALRKLRVTFDDPLFVKVGRRLVATERARELRVPLDEALAAVERVFTPRAALDPSTLRTAFRIGTADYGELVVLPRLVEALSEQAPSVDLVSVNLGDATEAALQRGEVDLVIGTRFRERSGLLFRPLRRDELVCVERSAGKRRSMTLARYLAARHVLVSPRGLPGGIVDEALRPRGIERRVVLTTPCFQTALATVARTSLITTVPRGVAEVYAAEHHVALHAAPLELPHLSFGLLYTESRRDDARHRWLRERIVELAAEPAERSASRGR